MLKYWMASINEKKLKLKKSLPLSLSDNIVEHSNRFSDINNKSKEERKKMIM